MVRDTRKRNDEISVFPKHNHKLTLFLGFFVYFVYFVVFRMT